MLIGGQMLKAQTSDVYLQQAEKVTAPLQRLDWLTAAIEENRDPHWPFLHMAYYQRGLAYRDMGFWEEAAEDFGRSLVYFKGYIPAYYERAAVLAKLERWSEVLEELSLVEQVEVNAFTHYAQRGEAYYAYGDYKSALNNFYWAIRIGQFSLTIFEKMVLAHIRGHEYEKALQVLKDWKSEIDRDDLYYFLKGLIYFLMQKAREWEVYKDKLTLYTAKSDALYVDLGERAETAFVRADQLGFNERSSGEWKEIPRVREHLNDFLRFYLKSSKLKSMKSGTGVN